jgi:HEPN domain-containing protein
MDNKLDLWFGLCDRDLKGAHGLLKTGNYVLAGYQCQQVVEKALKACIAYATADDPPRIHTLSKLAALTGLTSEFSDEQKNLINYLEPLYIEARYADYKAMILLQMTREYCKQLVTQTEEFLSWIKKRLSE